MMSDDFSELRPGNGPSSMEPDDSWLHLRLGRGGDNKHTCNALQSSRPLMPVGSMGVNGGCGLRIIRPPRQPHVGFWFMLQASQNQTVEPILPQIPKAYLRIVDGRMTVRLLKKYLAQKLRLKSESEVEITCRGKELEPGLTMQYARDNIWCREKLVPSMPHCLLMDSNSTLPSSSFTVTTEGVIMILVYASAMTISIPLLEDEN